MPPAREEMVRRLKATTKPRNANANGDGGEFDSLNIGGAATGADIAASRGLKVALVERFDFSSGVFYHLIQVFILIVSPPGTSSKSTKLVHGGVRYLQKAVFELDYEQWKLVKEALHERRIFLQTAPYLSKMLPIMLPVYKYVLFFSSSVVS